MASRETQTNKLEYHHEVPSEILDLKVKASNKMANAAMLDAVAADMRSRIVRRIPLDSDSYEQADIIESNAADIRLEGTALLTQYTKLMNQYVQRIRRNQ